MVLCCGKPAKATYVAVTDAAQNLREIASHILMRDRETDLNCPIGWRSKLVLTSPVTCDVMHGSLSRMRQRSWTLGSTAHAPMTKGLRSNLSILRDEAHQLNLDWKEFSYIRLQFIKLQRWCW